MTKTPHSQLHIETLGGLRISKNDQPLTGFYSRKAQTLLVYLAMSNRPQRRETLATLLWGDVLETHARASLRQALTNLRSLVGDHLATDRQTVSLIPDHIQLDVRIFEAHLQDLSNRTIDIPQLERALSHYHGDFLEGASLSDTPDFDIWVNSQRERLRDLAIKALLALVSRYAANNNDPAAITTLKHLLTLDPWREAAHRQLMEHLARSGQRTAALTQFQTCRQILADELGIEPEQATILTYQRIRDGQIAASPTIPTASEPPAATLPTLPIPQTTFIGRQNELDRISQLLNDPACRLITLVGPGGSGKTRLALHAMESHKANFTDGAVIIPLASPSTPDQQIPILTAALTITPDLGENIQAQVLAALRDKEMLLVIDNGDQLHTNISLLTHIVTNAPGIKMLVTSRERLAVQAEWLVLIDGLDCEFTASPSDAPSVQLFIERASRIQPNLDQSPENLEQIARICQLVGGLPLAIEIAASWTRTHSPQEIADRISNDLDFLATTTRDLPARHRSLRAVFDQSWAQLTEREQAIYRALATFHESFTQPAALAVAGASPLDLMTLIDKSLLRHGPSGAYRMHEFAHQYALEQLQQIGTTAAEVHHRHAVYFVDVLETSESQLKELRQIETLTTLENNIANIRTAWSWIVDHHDVDLASRALDGLCLFYEIRGWIQEGLSITQNAAQTFANQPDPDHQILHARLIGWQGRFHHFLGQFPQSETLTEQAHTLLRQHNAQHQLTFYLSTQGRNANVQGRKEEALQFQRAALAQAQATGDRYAMGHAFKHLGNIAFRTGDYPDAEQWFHKSLAIRREIGDWIGVAEETGNLGAVAHIRGDYTQAERHLNRAVSLYRELDRESRSVYPLTDLADVYCNQGRYSDAEHILHQCLQIAERASDQRSITLALHGLAKSARLQDHPQLARAHALRSLALSQHNNHQSAAAHSLAILATIAVQENKPRHARRYAQQSLTTALTINDHLTSAIARTLLSRIATTAAQQPSILTNIPNQDHTTASTPDQPSPARLLAEARDHLITALNTIKDSGARPATLDIIHTIAGLLLTFQQIHPLPQQHPDALTLAEHAATLFTHVARDHATWHQTRIAAQQQLDTLATRLPTATFTAAQQRAAILPLDTLPTLIPTTSNNPTNK